MKNCKWKNCLIKFNCKKFKQDIIKWEEEFKWEFKEDVCKDFSSMGKKFKFETLSFYERWY